MKKFKYLLSMVAVVLVLTTAVFAASTFTATGNITGATLNGTTIEYGASNADGFVFEYIAGVNIKGGQTTIDTSKLIADGWTITDIDGKVKSEGAFYSYADGVQVAENANSLVVKFASGNTYESTGKALIRFKATPSSTSKIDGVEFTVKPMFNLGGLYNKQTKYTLAKKADTPVVNKYNVTFTGYESKNMTDVEENTEITLPAAPAVDKNKEFVGWSDGTTTYEAGAKYTVTGNVTFTAVINDITLPTPVATKEAIISAEVDGKTYTDIFEGIYTLTPGKASLTKFGVKIPGKLNPADVREFATSGTFEGEGTFVYRVALFGVMDKADIAATPFAE